MVTTAKIVGALRRAKLDFSKSERSMIRGWPRVYSGFKVDKSALVGGHLVYYRNGDIWRTMTPEIIARYLDQAAAALDAAGIQYTRHAETLEIPDER